MRVKPAPGLSVRDPASLQLLTDEGLEVPDGDILWTKLLNDKDVVLMEGDWSSDPPADPPAEPLPEDPPADAALNQPDDKGATS